jgi:hypothetical protein
MKKVLQPNSGFPNTANFRPAYGKRARTKFYTKLLTPAPVLVYSMEFLLFLVCEVSHCGNKTSRQSYSVER